MLTIINFVLFQAGWLLTVTSGAGTWYMTGPLFAIGVVWWHLEKAKKPGIEGLLLFLICIVGFSLDSVLVSAGVLQFQNGQIYSFLAPVWMLALWLLFGTTLNVSLRWLKGRPGLAALFGAVGGPLAYFAGEKLGAVIIPDAVTAALALAVCWSALMPVLMLLSKRFDGFGAPVSAEAV